jgi:hypothetical protein
MNEEVKKELKSTTALPTMPLVDGFDGYNDRVEGTDDDSEVAGRLIQGTLIKFTNEAKWVTREGEEISPTLELIPVDALRVVQKWDVKRPVETIIVPLNEKIPNVDALNAKCPREEWRMYQGKLIGPWQFQRVVYFIDPLTMDKFTWPTGTTGGGICVREELVEKVKLMRQFRSEHCYMVCTLSDTFMNTKNGGRQRPHLIVKRWVTLGGGDIKVLPEPELKTVTEPTLKEQMGNDEVPFSDPIPVSIAKPPAVQSKPPAPSQTAPMTKRGVQKIAGGRRR